MCIIQRITRNSFKKWFSTYCIFYFQNVLPFFLCSVTEEIPDPHSGDKDYLCEETIPVFESVLLEEGETVRKIAVVTEDPSLAEIHVWIIQKGNRTICGL